MWTIEKLEEKRYIVKLNKPVVVITEENISKLVHLYGEMDIDDLSRIVNNHLKVAIDEIKEDGMKQKEQCCKGCGYVKEYDYGKKIYYCDHEGRSDDMGKLGVGELYEESPGWCPLRESKNKND